MHPPTPCPQPATVARFGILDGTAAGHPSESTGPLLAGVRPPVQPRRPRGSGNVTRERPPGQHQPETGHQDHEASYPLVTIVGDLVALGPLARDLLPLYHRWFNDFTVLRNLRDRRVTTMEEMAAWYETRATSDRYAAFTIYEGGTRRPVGYAALQAIDRRHATAEYFIVIGEPEARGKGYGTAATRLVLDYGFTVLGLHNIMLTVSEFNLAGRHAYEKAGFRVFGRRRGSFRVVDEHCDEIYMDCHASEFTSPVLSRVFAPDQPR